MSTKRQLKARDMPAKTTKPGGCAMTLRVSSTTPACRVPALLWGSRPWRAYARAQAAGRGALDLCLEAGKQLAIPVDLVGDAIGSQGMPIRGRVDLQHRLVQPPLCFIGELGKWQLGAKRYKRFSVIAIDRLHGIDHVLCGQHGVGSWALSAHVAEADDLVSVRTQYALLPWFDAGVVGFHHGNSALHAMG